MEKKHIIKFLKEKKRGVYALVVQMYPDVITSMAVTMALDIIKEDLEKESEISIELNYFSLAQAVAKFKKNNQSVRTVTGKLTFKDAHESKDQSTPGKFTVGQSK